MLAALCEEVMHVEVTLLIKVDISITQSCHDVFA